MAEEDSAAQAMSCPVAANTAQRMLLTFKLNPIDPIASDPVDMTWYCWCSEVELIYMCREEEGEQTIRGLM